MILIKPQEHEIKLNCNADETHSIFDKQNENDYHLNMQPNFPIPESPDVPAPAGGLPSAPRPRRATSRELLGEADQLVIEHDGREYRLRLTQNGKLILTA